MTSPLDRHARSEARRYVNFALVVTMASLTWHLLRPWLTATLAGSNFGAWTRTHLIASVLDDRFGNVAITKWGYGRWSYDVPHVVSYSESPQRYVYWMTEPAKVNPNDPTRVLRPRSWAIADDQFRLIGCLRGDLEVSIPPGDWNGDGSVEAVLQVKLSGQSIASAPRNCYGVIRLEQSRNTLLGAFIIECDPLLLGGSRILARWSMTPPRTAHSLTMEQYQIQRQPKGKSAVVNMATLATFEWVEPHGILLPIVDVDRGLNLRWLDEDRLPVELDPDTDMNALLYELFPSMDE